MMTTRPSRTKPTVPPRIEAEVQPTSARPSWTAAEKLALLAEYEAFPRGAAERGAFLRRHGLYTSPMSKWRHLRDQGALALLTPQARGPKPVTTEPLLAEYEAFPHGSTKRARSCAATGSIPPPCPNGDTCATKGRWRC